VKQSNDKRGGAGLSRTPKTGKQTETGKQGIRKPCGCPGDLAPGVHRDTCQASKKPVVKVPTEHPLPANMFVVRGLTTEGIEVWYTGRAGTEFTSTDQVQAFTYTTVGVCTA